MEKFKIGDKIRVKNDLIVDTFYDDGCKFISDMKDTLGKVGEIVRISRNEERIRYIIKLDSDDYYNPYCFSKSMLEPITKNNKMEIYRQDANDSCSLLKSFGIKVLIVNNPEVIAIAEDFNVFTARCHEDDIFNPKIGLEICYKKKRMNELKNEREEKIKELASIEKIIKNLKEDLGEY
jgi:hypothetical protein|nr:MAG TPA_asm: Mind bomb SH3 repeat domain [Caudoviricetes sp.]